MLLFGCGVLLPLTKTCVLIVAVVCDVTGLFASCFSVVVSVCLCCVACLFLSVLLVVVFVVRVWSC